MQHVDQNPLDVSAEPNVIEVCTCDGLALNVLRIPAQ
jgi:hypothetical protein